MKISQADYIAGKRTAITVVIGCSIIYGCATIKWMMPLIAGLTLGSVVILLIFTVFRDTCRDDG